MQQPNSKIDLVYLSLPQSGFDEDLEQALNLLDAQEYERYQRYKNRHAQQCYLQARRIVKTELAKRLNCQPREIRFSYNEKEKPGLINSSDWHFNITHCQSTLAIALAKNPVGIDAEDISRTQNLWQKSSDFLHPDISRKIEACVSAREAATLFTEHWCCTESYVKQKGRGIYQELKRVCALPRGDFAKGKYYRFEEVCFTVFDFLPDTRVSVACEGVWPEIRVLNWRNGLEEFTAAGVEC